MMVSKFGISFSRELFSGEPSETLENVAFEFASWRIHHGAINDIHAQTYGHPFIYCIAHGVLTALKTWSVWTKRSNSDETIDQAKQN